MNARSAHVSHDLPHAEARFHSSLAKDFAAYLALKRALGRKFGNEEKVLRHLDRFLARRFPQALDISVPVLDAWMAENPLLQARSRATRLRVVRPFCLFRRRTTPSAFVLDRVRHRTLWPVRLARRVPFIFTTAQVRALLRAALALPGTPGNPARPDMVFTLLLLLYTTGLRLSEAVRLRAGDVDFEAGTLLVRETKFFKTRIVPVALDVLERLRAVVREEDARVECPLFHRGDGRRPYCVTTIGALGCQLLRSCGLKPPTGRGGARLHDLRFTFAVHRIVKWYEEGADVQSLLPQLATYLGHRDIVSTQYYASVTVEMLASAGRRFENACSPSYRENLP